MQEDPAHHSTTATLWFLAAELYATDLVINDEGLAVSLVACTAFVHKLMYNPLRGKRPKGTSEGTSAVPQF